MKISKDLHISDIISVVNANKLDLYGTDSRLFTTDFCAKFKVM